MENSRGGTSALRDVVGYFWPALIIIILAAFYVLIIADNGADDARIASELPVMNTEEAVMAINAGRVTGFNVDEDGSGPPVIVIYFNDGTDLHRLTGHPPTEVQDYRTYLEENGAEVEHISITFTSNEEWD